jgi:hypothetical protein
MESDVASTLSELERKLKELERELETVGRGGETDAEPAQSWTPPPAAPASPEAPAPPPAGVTPFTASWHGSGQPHAQAAVAPPPPPPPPPPAYNGAPASVPVPRPPVWAAAAPPPPAPGAGLHRQLDELLAFRERLVRSTNDLVAELSRVLTDLGVDVSTPGPPATPDDLIFDGRITVEAGPFADLGTLAAFEQAIAHTAGVEAVAVRALDAGRATIDLQLGGPVALGRGLRQTASVGFTITAADEGLVHMSIAAGGGPP